MLQVGGTGIEGEEEEKKWKFGYDKNVGTGEIIKIVKNMKESVTTEAQYSFYISL
jgi:hypothetical protein